MKNTILSVIFILFISYVCYNTAKIMVNKPSSTNFNQYYRENKEHDVIFIGPSTVYYTISPMEIWNTYGIASYNRSYNAQTYEASYHLMKEAIKMSKPKVIVFDISLLLILENYKHSNNAMINNIPNIITRYNALKDIYGEDYKIEHMNIFSLYHTRWQELKQTDFYQYDFLKGMSYFGLFRSKPMTRNDYSKERTINEKVIRFLEKAYKLTKENNVELILITSPDVSTRAEIYNSFNKIAQQHHWTYFNYDNLDKDIQFDYSKDMFDMYHTNLYGGRKITNHVIRYIMETYHIPNRKNDTKFASWNKDYEKYTRIINKDEIKEVKEFDTWFNLAMYNDYVITIAARNGLPDSIDKNLINHLDKLGLSKIKEYKPKDNYIAIIDDKKVFDEQIGKDNLSFKGRMKRMVNLNISSKVNNADIFISGTNRSKNRNGLNFVIYDKVNREIIDSIWIDPNNSKVVNR